VKGVTGHMMVVIISIILGIIIIALLWLFLNIGVENIPSLFNNIMKSFFGFVCGLLGFWGKILMGGVC
jgi:predicted tellurium resistance membrane protein TerC